MKVGTHLTGCIFNIQRFSLHDGPGIRTTVFFKGCPLRCVWCHNPEGIRQSAQIEYSPKKCIGCGLCAEVCPTGAHTIRDGKHQLDFTLCKSCMACAAGVCPSGAVLPVGTAMDVSDVITEVLRDQSYYEKSGGGITLSGGEPFFQPEFAIMLLKEAHAKGIHTAVETCGFTSENVLYRVLPYVDLFLYDFKVSDSSLHKKLTGVPLEVILDNLKLLDSLGANIILRCPIIPDINNNIDHFKEIANIADKHKGICEVHLLPYHRLGVDKRERIGMEASFSVKPPTSEEIEKALRFISSRISKPVLII